MLTEKAHLKNKVVYLKTNQKNYIMKKLNYLLLSAFLLTTLLNSCTVEKRLYTGGYNIKWNKKYSVSDDSSKDEVAKAENTKQNKEKTEVKIINQEESATKGQDQVVNTEQNNPSTVFSTNSKSTNKAAKVSGLKSEIVETQAENINTTIFFENNSTSVSETKENSNGDNTTANRGLLFVLCFLIPWLAVGLATDWDVQIVIYNLLWSLTCIGAIIHAIIVVNREA